MYKCTITKYTLNRTLWKCISRKHFKAGPRRLQDGEDRPAQSQMQCLARAIAQAKESTG